MWFSIKSRKGLFGIIVGEMGRNNRIKYIHLPFTRRQKRDLRYEEKDRKFLDELSVTQI